MNLHGYRDQSNDVRCDESDEGRRTSGETGITRLPNELTYIFN